MVSVVNRSFWLLAPCSPCPPWLKYYLCLRGKKGVLQSVFIRVNPWFQRVLCFSLRSLRLCGSNHLLSSSHGESSIIRVIRGHLNFRNNPCRSVVSGLGPKKTETKIEKKPFYPFYPFAGSHKTFRYRKIHIGGVKSQIRSHPFRPVRGQPPFGTVRYRAGIAEKNRRKK